MTKGYGDDRERGRPPWREISQQVLTSLQSSPSYSATQIPTVYDELRRLGRHCQQYQRTGKSTQAQTLLRDAFKRLFALDIDVPERGQLSILAHLMRRLVVDYARSRKQRDTRGGMNTLIEDLRQHTDNSPAARPIDVLTMDVALDQLEQRHASSARLIELRYFADLGALDIALEVGVSTVTVERNLRFARTWLYTYLQNQTPS